MPTCAAGHYTNIAHIIYIYKVVPPKARNVTKRRGATSKQNRHSGVHERHGTVPKGTGIAREAKPHAIRSPPLSLLPLLSQIENNTYIIYTLYNIYTYIMYITNTEKLMEQNDRSTSNTDFPSE